MLRRTSAEINNDKFKPIRFFAPQSFGKPGRGTGTERDSCHFRSRTSGTFYGRREAGANGAKGQKELSSCCSGPARGLYRGVRAR